MIKTYLSVQCLKNKKPHKFLSMGSNYTYILTFKGAFCCPAIDKKIAYLLTN